MQVPIVTGSLRLGGTEIWLRMALLCKMPRLADRYQSRPTPITADRGHAIHTLGCRAWPCSPCRAVRAAVDLGGII